MGDHLCTTFNQLFLRNVIKIDATRCLDFNSKCTKMHLAAGLRLDPQEELGSLQRYHRTLNWIQGVLLLREGRGMSLILYSDLGDGSH